MTVERTNNVTHVYSNPDRYIGQLVAYSLLSQRTDTKVSYVIKEDTVGLFVRGNVRLNGETEDFITVRKEPVVVFVFPQHIENFLSLEPM